MGGGGIRPYTRSLREQLSSRRVGLTKYCKEVREARDCSAQVSLWTFLLVKVLLDAFLSSVDWQREDVLSRVLVHIGSIGGYL